MINQAAGQQVPNPKEEMRTKRSKKSGGKLRREVLVEVAKEMAEPRVTASARSPLLKKKPNEPGQTKSRPQPKNVPRRTDV
jgi:hypothetical protein